MTGRYQPGLFIIAGTFLFMGAGQAENGAVVVHISYVEVHDRILPLPAVTRTAVALEVHLSTNGTIKQNERRASGAARSDKDLSLRLGRPQEQAWHVAGANQLVNIKEYFTYRRAIEVTVSGNSCTARIGYNLKPGYHDYQYQRLNGGARATATSVSAAAVSCSIQ